MSDVAKRLSKRHRSELEQGSGISSEVIAARGYETIKTPERLAEIGYSSAQRHNLPGLLIPIRGVGGDVVSHQYKADKPRMGKSSDDKPPKPVKYDNPYGGSLHLDVPPSAAASLSSVSVPLWITEGSKKADAAVTAGLCCISLTGVWAWKNESGPLPDWDQIALGERLVHLAYDSDVMVKPEVQLALDALTGFLTGRGARVEWIILPPKPGLAGDEKVGLDDWLVAHDMDASGLTGLAHKPEINIKVNNVPLKQLTRQAINALRSNNSPESLFERDGVLIEATGLGVGPIEDKRLRHLMSESANWYKVSEKARNPVSPPPDVVGDVSAAHELWGLNRLDRIVMTPVFAGNGSLRTTPGYHRPSRSIYMPPEGLTVPDVSEAPTKSDVRKAKALIDEMLWDFVFVDEADRAHTWTMLLQPFARELIRGATPLYSVQAPKQGTGKTLLVQSVLAPAVGVVESYAEPHSDTEVEKRLTAIMREAAPVVFFDNVTRFVTLPSLASALTKPIWSSRILGISSTVTVPINCTFVITANNPRYSPDLLRRVVPIHLDARVEDPSKRTGFTHSLPAWALEHRGDLIWAACTIIASWVAADRPLPDEETPTLGSYGPWPRVMGGILTHAKIPGFLENLGKKALDKSPDEETFEAICAYAIGTFGPSESWYMADLAEGLIYAEIELSLSRRYRDIEELTQLLNPFLRSRVGQIVNGHLFERSEKRRSKGHKWRFKPIRDPK